MKILSVDFDIIMAPDINLYNPLVPHIPINKIIDNYPCLTGLRANLNYYQKLVNLLMVLSIGIKRKDICIAFSHEYINQFLIYDNNLEIVNIDHHHDLGYNSIDDFKGCNYANWVYYLFKQGKIKKYTWLNNNNSDTIPSSKQEDCFSSQLFCDITESQYINQFGKPDKIFICLSPEWVPLQYTPLFYLLLDLLNKQNNYTLFIY